MRSILLGAILILGSNAAAAQPCHEDAVSTAPGAYLYTQTGQTFQIFPGQAGRTATWLPTDPLTVCRISGDAFVLTDTGRRGEHVEALYLP